MNDQKRSREIPWFTLFLIAFAAWRVHSLEQKLDEAHVMADDALGQIADLRGEVRDLEDLAER